MRLTSKWTTLGLVLGYAHEEGRTLREKKRLSRIVSPDSLQFIFALLWDLAYTMAKAGVPRSSTLPRREVNFAVLQLTTQPTQAHGNSYTSRTASDNRGNH